MKTKILIIAILIYFFNNPLFAELGEIDIHGFISQGYMKSDHNNYLTDTEDGSFQFNDMGINFRTWAAPGLSIGAQFFASDLGELGNDQVTIDWAVAD